MSKKKKTVTAPLSYDPGKGRPKEYLAYLNWQEMQALQRLNGGNMERGPMGLPSFPPDWSGSANSTGNWQGAGGSVSPGAREGGGSDSGDRGGYSDTSDRTSSSDTTKTAESQQQSQDTKAQQEAENKNAVEAARSSALAQDARKAGIGSINVGPMQAPVKIGGGQVFGSLSRVASGSYGLSAPNRAPSTVPTTSQPISSVSSASAAEEMTRRQFTSDRLGPISYDPVIKQELKNALSQSMWDTRISDATRVAQGMKPRGAFGEVGPAGPLSGFRTLSQQAGIPSQYTKVKNPSRSYHTWGMAADVVPDRLPGETQPQYDYRVGEVNREIAKNINDPVVEWGGDWKFVDPAHFQYGSGSAQKSAKLYGSNVDQAGVRPATMVAVGPDAPSRTAYSGQIVRPQQVTSGVAPIPSGVEVMPASVELTKTENAYNPSVVPDPMAALAMAGLANIPRLVGNFEIPKIPEQSALVKMMPDAAKVAYANKMAADFAKKIPGALTAGLGALDRMVNQPVQVAAKPYQERLITTGDTTYSVGPEDFKRMDPIDREQIDRAQQAQTYDPDFMGPLGGSVVRNVDPDDFVGPTNVDQEVQKIIADQERKNRIGVEVMQRTPYAGSVLSAVEGIQKLFTGKDIAELSTDLKNKYMQAGPTERAALRDKYPDMRRFAVSIGDIPPNTGTQVASSGASNIGPEPGGKGNDFGSPSYGNYPTSYGGDYSTAAAMETGRPSQYFLWDLGVGIPSPGDPEYNDYQKYLSERGASAEV